MTCTAIRHCARTDEVEYLARGALRAIVVVGRAIAGAIGWLVADAARLQVAEAVERAGRRVCAAVRFRGVAPTLSATGTGAGWRDRRKQHRRDDDDDRHQRERKQSAFIHASREVSLGNRVVAAGPERMAPRDTAQGKPATAHRAMSFECLDGVRGAAWIITARGGQQRRERHLVAAHEQDENGAHDRTTSLVSLSVTRA